MISFERSTDYDLIRAVITHPKLYPNLSDDFSPAAEDYRPAEHQSVWYVTARDDENDMELLGLWMFHPQNGVCWEVHTALLPSAWGERGLRAARALPYWIFSHTPCRRIITNVPETNRLALHFAAKAGMKIYGFNESSYLKHGRLIDQVCLGISAVAEPFAEEEVCHSQQLCLSLGRS